MMLIRAGELGEGFKSKPYFDVHDELVFTVKKEEEQEYLTRVILPAYNRLNEQCERWFGVTLPFKFRFKIKKGPNYGELTEVSHASNGCA